MLHRVVVDIVQRTIRMTLIADAAVAGLVPYLALASFFTVGGALFDRQLAILERHIVLQSD